MVDETTELEGFKLEYSHDGIHFATLAAVPVNSGKTYDYLHKMLSPGSHFTASWLKKKTVKIFTAKLRL